jgi:hypothetical protein
VYTALIATAPFLIFGASQVRFVQAVEAHRPDVLVLDQNLMSTEWFQEKQGHNFPNVTFPAALYWPSRSDGYDMKQFLDHNINRFRIFMFPFFKETSPLSAYALVPLGYCQEVVPCASKGNCNAPREGSVRSWGKAAAEHLPKPSQVWQYPASKYPHWIWEGFYRIYHADSVMRYAKFALDHRNVVSGGARLAAKWYEELLDLDAGSADDPAAGDDSRLLSRAHVLQLHRNRGIACYLALIEGDAAYKECAIRELNLYLQFLKLEPLNTNEDDKQQIMNILKGMM